MSAPFVVDLRHHRFGLEDAVGHRVASDLAVEGVTLDGGLAGLADQALDVVEVEFLVRRAGVSFALGDVVPDDGAVEVVAAVVEGDLGEADADATEITKPEQIPTDWTDSIPFGEDNEEGLTCTEVVERLQAEKAQRALDAEARRRQVPMFPEADAGKASKEGA